MNNGSTLSIEAEPYAFDIDARPLRLLIIDMQRDFLESGGFGEALGNDVSQLRRTIEPNRRLLKPGAKRASRSFILAKATAPI